MGGHLTEGPGLAMTVFAGRIPESLTPCTLTLCIGAS